MPAGTAYLVKENLFSKTMKKEMFHGKEAYRFSIKNNFLHAVHPLGWFREIELTIDGKGISEENMYFVLRKQCFRVSEIHQISEVFWKLCEPMEVYFLTDEPINVGEHSIRITFHTSMLEDTRILDLEDRYPERVEFSETKIELN